MQTAIQPIPPQQTAVPSSEETIAALLRIVPAAKVYCRDGCLHIVVGEEAVHSLHQYKVLLEGADWNPAGAGYALYPAGDVRRGLDEGRIFYNTVFTPVHLVYDSGRCALPSPLPLRVAQTEQQAREAFWFGYGQSCHFLQCAQYMEQQGAANVAAFLLHQSVELLLRAFIIAVTGQEVRTHTLADLMKHTLRYAPGLRSCAGVSGEQLAGLPGKLEKAYVCGRYSPHFGVSAAGLPALSADVAALQEEVFYCFGRVVMDYAGGIRSNNSYRELIAWRSCQHGGRWR